MMDDLFAGAEAEPPRVELGPGAVLLRGRALPVEGAAARRPRRHHG